MGHTTRTRWAMAIAVAGLALALPVSRADAATTTTTVNVTGAVITRTDVDASTSLLVKATVPRLDLWCSSNKLVANRITTAIPCDRLVAVTTNALAGDDTVVINATGFGTSFFRTMLTVKTGAGNDVVSIRHRGDLVVWAGAGNDRIEAGLASGVHPVTELLQGEGGDDTLANLGFITAPRVEYDPEHPEVARALASTLRGGPGADRLATDRYRWSDLALDARDLITAWNGGPATLSPERAVTTPPPWSLDVAASWPRYGNTLTIGTATALDVGCVPSADGQGRYRVNGLVLPEPCAVRPLDIVGTDRPDAVAYDQKLGVGYDATGLALELWLGGGDDTAAVRHPYGHVGVRGGEGNDRITAGIYNSRPNGEDANIDLLLGDAGDDVLTNLGFLDPNPPRYEESTDPHVPTLPYAFSTYLDGGPGADRLVGAATTREELILDGTDTVVDTEGPTAYSIFTGAGNDSARVRLDTATPTITWTTGATTRTIVGARLTTSITVSTEAGRDVVKVDGASPRTYVNIDGGDGTDRVVIRPDRPAVVEEIGLWTVVHPDGWFPISWLTESIESSTIQPPT